MKMLQDNLICKFLSNFSRKSILENGTKLAYFRFTVKRTVYIGIRLLYYILTSKVVIYNFLITFTANIHERYLQCNSRNLLGFCWRNVYCQPKNTKKRNNLMIYLYCHQI